MNIKRYLVAGAAAATLAGGAFAFAANLDIDSQTLASGSATTSDLCDSLDVTYTTAYTELTYELATIHLDGGEDCASHTYKVTIDDSSSNGVEFTGDLDGTNGTTTIDVSASDIDVDYVEHVTAVVTD
jgi:hypothetical protein